ncbi:hypothetical protein BE21_38680 [Sorangium cellulosum]|uniref:Secreted protein n=1 Tax=Sorangium cellulosum TaxID=56 RepID=A0A150TMD6_SORCE|nr:hypothetical protein BE21_38680 [Sorangium cellulosum]
MKLALSFTVALALAMLAGCGTSPSGLCEDKCDCTGACSERDEVECIDALEDAERTSEYEGCEDQFDEAISCIDDAFVCDGRDVDISGCSRPLENLGECAGPLVSLAVYAQFE